MPLLLMQEIHLHRNQGLSAGEIRTYVMRGVYRGFIAALVLLIPALLPEIPLRWWTIYLYHGAIGIFAPVLYAIFAARAGIPAVRDDGASDAFLYICQMTGFFFVYNLAIFLFWHGSLDQVRLFMNPLLYITGIFMISSAVWREYLFEKAWRIIMWTKLVVIFLMLPVPALLYYLGYGLGAWLVEAGVILLAVVQILFYRRLATDIQYRLNLEARIKPLMRLLSR